MQDICCKLSRMAAVAVVLMAACVGSAWAQNPWQTNDLVLCYGGGKCNAERLVNGTTPTFLNSLSAGSGDVRGAALNNSLHLLVTNGGSGTSNVVQFSIATINPFSGATVPQSATSFPSSGGNSSNNAQAVAVNSGGHMFVGNSGSGTPQASIVELDAHGVRVTPTASSIFTFPTASDPCATTSLSSLDLSADGNAIYVTSGDGKIRRVGPLSSGLSSAACSVFADFGPGVSLFGIKDIPAGALAGNCPSDSCPTETVLVVAKGFVDLDTGETTGESGETNNPDAVNVCTNTPGGSAESCALLLDTTAPTTPLSGAVWAAGNPYTSTSTTILDAYLHVQQVFTPGTSGSDEPIWAHNSGSVVRDNAVVWKDLGTPVAWAAHHTYSQGDLTIGAGHVQQETVGSCTSGVYATVFSTPAWFTDGATPTPDGTCSWTDLGVSGSWVATTPYVTNNAPYTGELVTSSGNVQQVQIAGTSGPSTPAFSTTVGGTVTDGLQWQDQGASPAVIARYRVQAGDTLQALALDPLVSDCQANACTTLASIPARKLANFWLADTGSGNVFKVAFADGTHQNYDTDAAVNCPGGHCGSGIHSIVIYGGESAAQPGLASLLLGGSLQSPNFTATQTILDNTITSTLYGTSLPTTPISLYASLVPTSSCFNDSNVGSLPCRETVSGAPGEALVWKIDIPQGQAQKLPTSQTLNTAFASTGSFGIDAGTDVFVDMGYDDTTFVGTDPGTRTVSVHSLHEIPTANTQSQSQCQFSSPLANTCYKLNRSTLNFSFSCPGLSPTQLASLNPMLSLVKKNTGQAPQFIPSSDKTATNGKAAFRFDRPHNIWTYQLSLSGFAPGTYLGTAFDFANVVPSFTTGIFTLDNSCK